MKTVSDVIGLWPSISEFAADIGIRRNHAEVMKVRGTIPDTYWWAMMKAAKRRGIDLTLEHLAKMRDRKRPARSRERVA